MTCYFLPCFLATFFPGLPNIFNIVTHFQYIWELSDPCESQPHKSHLNSKTVPILPSLDHSLIFFIHLLYFLVYSIRFSFCFFPGFLAIFILLLFSCDPSLIFFFHLLPFSVHPTGFSFCFSGFLAIFILLSFS